MSITIVRQPKFPWAHYKGMWCSGAATDLFVFNL